LNITGGSNLSLYEVQEAADIVATASDQEVNMIFGSVINENLKDEIVVTVIATGFTEHEINPLKQPSRQFGTSSSNTTSTKPPAPKREVKREETTQEVPTRNNVQSSDDALDIPTFLRNRNKRR
jgi:cell division protein FtsZ